MVQKQALPIVLLVLAVAVPISGATAASTDSTTVAIPHEEVGNPDGNITVLRGADPLYESIDTPDQLTVARNAGQIRQPNFLAPGDLLVLQFESARVTDTYANTTGTNSTDRFFTMLESTETNFTILGLNHGAEQLPSRFNLNRSNVNVLHDANTDTFSLLLDTANISVVDRRSGDQIMQTLEHRLFQAIVEIPTENETRVLTGSSEFAGVGTSLETPMDSEAIDGYLTPTISENATDNLTLTGSTPFLPNTSVTIRANVSDGSTLATHHVETYNANTSTAGFEPTEFNTTFALPNVNANDTIEVAVLKNGTVLAERTLLIGQQPKMTNTSARLVTSDPQEGEIAVTATIRVPEPGLLLVYTDHESESVTVPAGETVERTLYVDTAAVGESGAVNPIVVWDRNENEVHDPDIDLMYSTTLDVGASVEDRELDTKVRVEGWPPDTTTSTTSSREQTKTTEKTTTENPTTTESTATTTPGFGQLLALLGVSVAALSVMRYANK